MANDGNPRLFLTDLEVAANSEWELKGQPMHRYFTLRGPSIELDRAMDFYSDVGARLPVGLAGEYASARRLVVRLSDTAVVYTGSSTESRPIHLALVPPNSRADVVLTAVQRDVLPFDREDVAVPFDVSQPDRSAVAVRLDLALVTFPSWGALLVDRGVSDIVRVSGALPADD